MKNPSSSSVSPWYRERWPWLLMAGPATVVVAGALTSWIAFATRDGLVADDYYKRGLAINREIRKEEAARRMGIAAEVLREGNLLRVKVAGDSPPALFVQLVHATREGNDLRLRLAPKGDAYVAELPALAPGHWRAIVEEPQGRWRIVKERL